MDGLSKLTTSFVGGFAKMKILRFHLHFPGIVEFLLIQTYLTNFYRNSPEVVLYLLNKQIEYIAQFRFPRFERLSRLVNRQPFFLLSFTCDYVVSVRRGFLFLLVLGIGCVTFL